MEQKQMRGGRKMTEKRRDADYNWRNNDEKLKRGSKEKIENEKTRYVWKQRSGMNNDEKLKRSGRSNEEKLKRSGRSGKGKKC